MTVRMLIKQLMDYNMDAQVVDTYGSPIMYSVYARPNKWVTDKDVVRLEPKSQMDINTELDAYFQSDECWSMSDIDVLEDLKECGYTLDDLKEYNGTAYEWAKNLITEYELYEEECK